MTNILKLGIPAGSLQEATAELFRRAGYKITFSSRSYYPTIDDDEIECLLIRAQEMARYVEEGMLDAGLTGYDWIMENGSDVLRGGRIGLLEGQPAAGALGALRARGLAGENGPRSPRQADRHRGRGPDHSLPGPARRHGEGRVQLGATEVKPPKLVDAIVEVTETGSSLRANNLRIVDEVLQSTTRFIANRAAYADPWKKQKIDDIVLMLQGAMAAEGKVGLMMNVPRKCLEAVLALAARPAAAHHFRPGRRSLGRREHDPRRIDRAPHHSPLESRRRPRNRRVSARTR